MTISKNRYIMWSCLLSTVAACSQQISIDGGAPASPGATGAGSRSSEWQANGATACEKYLTSDEVSKVLPTKVAGNITTLSAEECVYKVKDAANFGAISIRLSGHINTEMFKAVASHLENPAPLQGVGDIAVLSGLEGSYILMEAMKGNDRYCEIKVMVSSRAFMALQNQVAGPELGAICGKLFALAAG